MTEVVSFASLNECRRDWKPARRRWQTSRRSRERPRGRWQLPWRRWGSPLQLGVASAFQEGASRPFRKSSVDSRKSLRGSRKPCRRFWMVRPTIRELVWPHQEVAATLGGESTELSGSSLADGGTTVVDAGTPLAGVGASLVAAGGALDVAGWYPGCSRESSGRRWITSRRRWESSHRDFPFRDRWGTSHRRFADIDPSTKRFRKIDICQVRQNLPLQRLTTDFTYEFVHFPASAAL